MPEVGKHKGKRDSELLGTGILAYSLGIVDHERLRLSRCQLWCGRRLRYCRSCVDVGIVGCGLVFVLG